MACPLRCQERGVAEPPREIHGARVIRYAGDPAWSEMSDEQWEKHVSGMSTVVAMPVIDYGYRLDPDDPDDHYVLRLHVEGTVSDDNPGERMAAICAFNEEARDLGLDEIPMLPSPWNDIRGDAQLEAQRTAALREEFGESDSCPWGLRCAATCRECDAALLEIGRSDWAVVRAGWGGKDLEPGRALVVAYGTREDVRRSVDRHASGTH